MLVTGFKTIFTIKIIATDYPFGASISSQFTLTVSNNYPVKTKEIPDITKHLGIKLDFYLQNDVFYDNEGDKLTFVANYGASGALPSWISFDPIF